MHLLNPSPLWLPYFGNQRRFVPFVKELLVGLGAKEGDKFFETNAGSHAISYHMATELGLHPTANDLGYYSQQIGKALTGDGQSIIVAATGAALIEEHGYQPPFGARFDDRLFSKWTDFLVNQEKPESYQVIRGDLFQTLNQHSGKFIYCDFAWPWRDGSATEEYTVTADTLGILLGDQNSPTFKMASGRRILDDVIRFLDAARQRYEFVILSNQSSNYPTPEVLEAHMRACGHTPIISRRQTVPAEFVDDLGKDPNFTEYQYVFEGVPHV